MIEIKRWAHSLLAQEVFCIASKAVYSVEEKVQ
jgi:hypothetical protein